MVLDQAGASWTISTVWNPKLADLRAKPLFVAHLEGLGVEELWEELGPPPDCRQSTDGWECGLIRAAGE